MTKSTGVGRGGPRLGAGRKPNPLSASPITEGLQGTDAELARETLRHIAANGVSEAARVAAAKELWDRAEGKVGPKAVESSLPKPEDKWGSILDEPRPN